MLEEDWRLFVEGAMDEARPGVPYNDLWPLLWRQKEEYEKVHEAWINLEGNYARRQLVHLLDPHKKRNERRCRGTSRKTKAAGSS